MSLVHDRHGQSGAPAVLLLHGWPGDRHDTDAVAARLADGLDVIVPDLRGFGESTVDPEKLPDEVGARAQVSELVELLEELGVRQVVVGAFDVGSVVAQTLARTRPELIRALMLAPPFPGAGERVLAPEHSAEFWYQQFHQLALADRLIDGSPQAARHYLEHFWSHWSGSGYSPPADHLDRLAEVYGAPGAFSASIAWYRAGSGTLRRALSEEPPAPERRLATPLHALWPREDPLFPLEWSDRLDQWFTRVALTPVDCGHFLPVEAPDALAAAIRAAARR